MESNERSRDQNFRPHHSHRGNRGNRGHRPHRGRGDSKLTRKFNSRANQRNNNYNSYTRNVISMENNLPSSIDLTNSGLVEHIGEIFFKESFLEDPWNKLGNHEGEKE